MKSIMCAIGAVALCGAVYGVESDTVGYVTSTVAASGNKTFAVTLTDCANPGTAIAIDKLFTNTDFVGGAFDGADQIWRWDTTVNKWAKYFYEKKGRGATATYAWKKWNYASSVVEDLTDADAVQPGQTFLFRRTGGAAEITLTLSGRVAPFNDSGASYSLSASANVFMAYGWPVDLKISDFMDKASFTVDPVGGAFDGADQIWRWDTTVNKWAKYFYEKKGRGATATYAWKKWNYASSVVEDLTDADKVSAGEGFLYRRTGGSATTVISWKALQAE